jgi:hypothetical protein
MAKGIMRILEDATPDACPIVEIHWRDIRTVSRWNEEEEARPARRINTVGYLVYDGIDPEETSEEIVIIAGSYDYEEDWWSEVTVYPKKAYRGITHAQERIANSQGTPLRSLPPI